ncbi:MAG: hypothetical protein RR295_02220 [Oscillospiraceae bacterium]
MELYRELLAKRLEREEMQVCFPNLKMDVAEIVEMDCYRALQKIKTIVEDDGLEDRECFLKIEEIITVFEGLGSHCGNRHDFG